MTKAKTEHKPFVCERCQEPFINLDLTGEPYPPEAYRQYKILCDDCYNELVAASAQQEYYR